MIGSPLPGVRLLTRVPLPAVVPDDAARLGASVTFFPLVGFGIGALLAGLDALLRPWLAVGVVDALLLAALAAVTGLFHLDGLMDAADGLLGQHCRERRLEIMRDSHVGAFGVAAFGLVLLTQYAALGALAPGQRPAALLCMGIGSRWSIVLLARLFPYARPFGTGQAIHAGATTPRVLGASLLACALAALIGGPGGLLLLGGGGFVALALGWYAAARLGGLTGDVYGAGVVLAETATLLAAPLALGEHWWWAR